MDSERPVVVLRSAWLPTRQANGIQTVRMCEAFASLGLPVRLYYIPQPRLGDDIAAYYNLQASIDLQRLPRAVLPLRKNFKLNHRWAAAPSFAHAFLWCGWVTQIASRTNALFYFVREPMLAWWLGLRHLPTVFEIHHDYTTGGIENPFTRTACRRASVNAVVAVTEAMREDLIRQFGVPAAKTLTLPNGVDCRRFTAITKDAARHKLGLAPEARIVAYAGQLREEKGVDILVRAAAALKNVDVLLVGGDAGDQDRLRRLARAVGADNVKFAGHVVPDEVVVYLKAADVLVLPHSGKIAESAKYTCPIKLFEYMAAAVPMVAAEIPAVREIIKHGENGWLVPPDNAGVLAEAIRRLLENENLAAALAQKAAHGAQNYTWEKRAVRIVESLGLSGLAGENNREAAGATV